MRRPPSGSVFREWDPCGEAEAPPHGSQVVLVTEPGAQLPRTTPPEAVAWKVGVELLALVASMHQAADGSTDAVTQVV